MDICILGKDDAAVLDHVAEDVFDFAINKEKLTSYLSDTRNILCVAAAEGTVVGQARGFIVMHPDKENDFYIENLGVTPKHQRKGIATQLIQTLTAEARNRGCDEFWVMTEDDNTTAIAFYQSLKLYQYKVAMFSNSNET